MPAFADQLTEEGVDTADFDHDEFLFNSESTSGEMSRTDQEEDVQAPITAGELVEEQ